jgi:hypothetical protein
MNKIFSNLGRWQNYVHYLMLTLTIFLVFDMEEVSNFFLLYAVLFVADTLVHLTFSLLPGKLKWKD